MSRGLRALLMEAECLVGDDRNAAQFFVGEREISVNFIQIGGVARDVQQVGDGLERVVDFMRDGSGQAADCCKFFILEKRVLGEATLRNVEGDTEHLQRTAVFEVKEAAARLDPVERAVGPEETVFRTVEDVLFDCLAHGGADDRPVVRVHAGDDDRRR